MAFQRTLSRLVAVCDSPVGAIWNTLPQDGEGREEQDTLYLTSGILGNLKDWGALGDRREGVSRLPTDRASSEKSRAREE